MRAAGGLGHGGWSELQQTPNPSDVPGPPDYSTLATKRLTVFGIPLEITRVDTTRQNPHRAGPERPGRQRKGRAEPTGE